MYKVIDEVSNNVKKNIKSLKRNTDIIKNLIELGNNPGYVSGLLENKLVNYSKKYNKMKGGNIPPYEENPEVLAEVVHNVHDILDDIISRRGNARNMAVPYIEPIMRSVELTWEIFNSLLRFKQSLITPEQNPQDVNNNRSLIYYLLELIKLLIIPFTSIQNVERELFNNFGFRENDGPMNAAIRDICNINIPEYNNTLPSDQQNKFVYGRINGWIDGFTNNVVNEDNGITQEHLNARADANLRDGIIGRFQGDRCIVHINEQLNLLDKRKSLVLMHRDIANNITIIMELLKAGESILDHIVHDPVLNVNNFVGRITLLLLYCSTVASNYIRVYGYIKQNINVTYRNEDNLHQIPNQQQIPNHQAENTGNRYTYRYYFEPQPPNPNPNYVQISDAIFRREMVKLIYYSYIRKQDPNPVQNPRRAFQLQNIKNECNHFLRGFRGELFADMVVLDTDQNEFADQNNAYFGYGIDNLINFYNEMTYVLPIGGDNNVNNVNNSQNIISVYNDIYKIIYIFVKFIRHDSIAYGAGGILPNNG